MNRDKRNEWVPVQQKVRGQDHALYWIYRERMVGAGEDAEPRWYLHGLFG